MTASLKNQNSVEFSKVPRIYDSLAKNDKTLIDFVISVGELYAETPLSSNRRYLVQSAFRSGLLFKDVYGL